MRGQKWTLPDGKDISYFEGHLMGVYHIVEEGGVQDDELLVTALLHDILEDTQVTEKQLRNMFGIRIADNVKWLTRREGLSYEQYIDELLVHGSDEARLVKLADRLHNTNNLMNLGSEQWHEKKIDQAKYMLDKFPEREFAENTGKQRKINADNKNRGRTAGRKCRHIRTVSPFQVKRRHNFFTYSRA